MNGARPGHQFSEGNGIIGMTYESATIVVVIMMVVVMMRNRMMVFDRLMVYLFVCLVRWLMDGWMD